MCPTTSIVIVKANFILKTSIPFPVASCFLVGDTSFTVFPFGPPVSTRLLIVTYLLPADCVEFPLNSKSHVVMTSENETKPDYEVSKR